MTRTQAGAEDKPAVIPPPGTPDSDRIWETGENKR